MLRLHGHGIVITADQATALAMLRGGVTPALCLLDGPVDPELAAELNGRSCAGGHHPVVLLQPVDGLAERPAFPTSLALTKPVTERELLAAVASMAPRGC